MALSHDARIALALAEIGSETAHNYAYYARKHELVPSTLSRRLTRRLRHISNLLSYSMISHNTIVSHVQMMLVALMARRSAPWHLSSNPGFSLSCSRLFWNILSTEMISQLMASSRSTRSPSISFRAWKAKLPIFARKRKRQAQKNIQQLLKVTLWKSDIFEEAADRFESRDEDF
jgi:hypothetical protein